MVVRSNISGFKQNCTPSMIYDLFFCPDKFDGFHVLATFGKIVFVVKKNKNDI
jgi:hypothetical protein